MNAKFIIEPYVGTDIVKFGLTAKEVAKILGPPDRVDLNYLGERSEDRARMSVTYCSKNEKAVEFAFVPGASLVFEDRELFEERDVIGFLTSIDPHPYVSHGFVVFLELGLTATGFHDNNDAQKAFTIFQKGRWDDADLKDFVS